MLPTVHASSRTGYIPAYVSHLESCAKHHDLAFADGVVRWRQFGAGRPVVLLHGGHGSWMHWILNIAALAEKFTVLVPDLPGYGNSDLPTLPDLSSLVNATAATLDHIVGSDAEIDFVGFSFGGLIAAHIASMSTSVRRLALLGPAGHGTARRQRGTAIHWRHLDDEAELAAAMKHNLAVQMIHQPTCIDELAMFVHRSSCVRARFHSKTFSRSSSLPEALALYTGNLLLVWGEHDVTADPAVLSNTLAARHLRRQVKVIGGAGHWVQYERAAEVNQLLLEWLDKETANIGSAASLQGSGVQK